MAASNIRGEILKKSSFLTAETLDVLNGGHFSTYHSGVSVEELRRRKKNIASSFNSMADINVALELAFSDAINAVAIEKALKRAAEGDREEVPFFADYNLGYALVKSAKGEKVLPCSCGYFVIKLIDEDYRNKMTGMPFEVITCILEPEEE